MGLANSGDTKMNKDEKKAAVAAYKERKIIAGIYAVRCGPSAQIWVGQAPNVDTIRNRIWSGLRLGGDPHPDLRSAWASHGEDSFSFEVLERLDEEELPYIRNAILKERAAYWRLKLAALAI